MPTGTPTERETQRAVTQLYKLLGASVYNLAQGYRPGPARHGTTRQTKGLPDLYVMFPQRNLAFWHEVKRPGGQQSAEQRDFQQRADACGVAYVLGGLEEAKAHLRRIGFGVMLVLACLTGAGCWGMPTEPVCSNNTYPMEWRDMHGTVVDTTALVVSFCR